MQHGANCQSGEDRKRNPCFLKSLRRHDLQRNHLVQLELRIHLRPTHRQHTLSALREEAKSICIQGYSRLPKQTLITLLNEGPLISKTKLLKRGWIEEGITMFLGEPDHTIANLRYLPPSDLMLYRTTRIDLVEETSQFQEFQHASGER